MTSRFVIIGNGVAGITAALTIRSREPAASITIISGESDYFFSRTALMYAYMDRMALPDLEPFERKMYARQKLSLLRGQVVDIDAQRRILHLRSGASVQYEKLLLACGSLPNQLDLPGLSRISEGVAHFVTLQDLERCEALTPSTEEAVVIGGGLIGVELVECLLYHRKKVTFIVREPWYWPIALRREEGELVSSHLRKHGVDLLLNQEVVAVKGTGGRVESVTTSSGKEVRCQMLGIAIGVHPAIEWLSQATTPPAVGRGILISPDFRTSLGGVWAAGDCAELEKPGGKRIVEQIWYAAKRQGELAARAMLGDPVSYQPPLFYNSAKFFDIEFTTVGNLLDLPAETAVFHHRFSNREASISITLLDGAVVGFNALGSRWNHVYVERWISERRSLDYVVEHLQEAQFDVEFGRQDLQSLRTAFSRSPQIQEGA